MAMTPLWKTLAASAASTRALRKTSRKCSTAPAPPEATSGMVTDLRGRPQLRQVIALAHAVLVHAVQHDLAGAPVGGLADPVERAAAGWPGLVGVAGVLIDEPVAVFGLAVDADDDALGAERLGDLADQPGILQRRRIDARSCRRRYGGCARRRRRRGCRRPRKTGCRSPAPPASTQSLVTVRRSLLAVMS